MAQTSFPIVGAREISLTRGNYVAIVDSEDYDRVIEFSATWQPLVLKRGLVYAKTEKRFGPRWMNQRTCTCLHGLILNRTGPVTDDLEISHHDGNGLNCQKNNLSIVTRSVNQLQGRGLQTNNTSTITGVSWHSLRQKWCAEVRFEGKKYYLGLFASLEEAYTARAAKEAELWAQIRSR